jgi:hypothetical protein
MQLHRLAMLERSWPVSAGVVTLWINCPRDLYDLSQGGAGFLDGCLPNHGQADRTRRSGAAQATAGLIAGAFYFERADA